MQDEQQTPKQPARETRSARTEIRSWQSERLRWLVAAGSEDLSAWCRRKLNDAAPEHGPVPTGCSCGHHEASHDMGGNGRSCAHCDCVSFTPYPRRVE